MSDPREDKAGEAPLNPALKSGTETAHDTRSTSPPPYDTASAREGEGEGWPILWLVVILVCVAIAVYLIV